MSENETMQPNGESLAIQTHARSLLEVIANAATDPRCDVGKMERLLAMQMTIMEEQRKAAFALALARLQAGLPQIDESGVIKVGNDIRSRYAKMEDIDTVIRPLLAEEGFSVSYDEVTASPDGKLFKFSCTLLHREGHSVTKHLPMPLDASQYRSGAQSVGSTVKYARRYLLAMHLNLVTRGEDDDGQGGAEPITQEQADTLQAMVAEVGANLPKFLAYMGVEALKDILCRDFKKAISALETKRRAKK